MSKRVKVVMGLIMSFLSLGLFVSGVKAETETSLILEAEDNVTWGQESHGMWMTPGPTATIIASPDVFPVTKGAIVHYTSDDGGETWRVNGSSTNESVYLVVGEKKCYKLRVRWENYVTEENYSDYSNIIDICVGDAQPQDVTDPGISGQAISDIEGNVFEEFIMNLVDDGVVKGYPDGTYQPDKEVTRGEFSKFVKNAFELETNTDCTNFPDVNENHTFYEYATTLKCEGIVSGYGNGEYKPDNLVTREAATKFLTKAMESKGAIFNYNVEGGFPDVSGSNKFRSYIGTLTDITVDGVKIIKGYGDGTFKPGRYLTRGEMSKMTDIARRVDNSEYDYDLSKVEDNGYVFYYPTVFSSVDVDQQDHSYRSNEINSDGGYNNIGVAYNDIGELMYEVDDSICADFADGTNDTVGGTVTSYSSEQFGDTQACKYIIALENSTLLTKLLWKNGTSELHVAAAAFADGSTDAEKNILANAMDFFTIL